MACYMIQASYTPEAWATLKKNPEDRMSAVRPVIESVGGKLHEGFLSFGEYDVVVITEVPDNMSAAALSIAFSSRGALESVKTTPLLSMEEAVAAMRRADELAYEPPA